MPLPALLPFLTVAATWLGRIGLALFAFGEVKKLTSSQTDHIENSMRQAEAQGLSADEQQKLIAATTYEQVEKGGKSPDDFWNGLSDSEKGLLKYSPDTVRSSMERTSFLGIAQTILWVAAAAALGYAAFRGVPVVSKGLGNLVAARQRGVGALETANILAELKTGILQKTWIPGTIAGIAAGGGWLFGGLANNMNDAFLWGPTFLDQAAGDVQKAYDNLRKGGGGTGSGVASPAERRTIIRMIKEEKPMQFIGTLFSAKLGNVEQFERKLDDEITDMDDLKTDVKLNLNRWLGSLPGRMGYSVVIRKDPVDEFGVQQSGIWATLTLHILHISGKITPIDTVLLGPVNPKVRLELQKKTTTIETDMPDFLTATEIREMVLPSGIVDIFNEQGERVFSDGQTGAPVETAPAPAPTVPVAKWGYAYRAEAKPGDAGQQMFTSEQKSQYIGYGFTILDVPIFPGTVYKPQPVPPSSGSGSSSGSGGGTSSGTTSALATSGTLRRGSKGEAVKELQVLLNNWGETLVIDGDFGSKTDAAVRKFQGQNGLVIDGLVGSKTKAKLFLLGK